MTGPGLDARAGQYFDLCGPPTPAVRRRQSAIVCATQLAAAVVLACLTPLSFGQQKPAPYAVLAGTVFQEDGRALRGAEVSVRPSPEGVAAPKAKPLTAITDPRGEFALRVPAAPMRYTVGVKAPGFRPQEKYATIQGDERVDVYFQMEKDAPGK